MQMLLLLVITLNSKISNPSTALNLVGGGGVIVVPEGTTADTPTFNPMFSECNQASKPFPKILIKHTNGK